MALSIKPNEFLAFDYCGNPIFKGDIVRFVPYVHRRNSAMKKNKTFNCFIIDEQFLDERNNDTNGIIYITWNLKTSKEGIKEVRIPFLPDMVRANLAPHLPNIFEDKQEALKQFLKIDIDLDEVYNEISKKTKE